MQKMMTYSEANSVLDVSLSPTNRCLSKSVAIANDADEDLLADFANARLVPASAVEPGTHWIDEHTIEHYFVDENGNNLGTSLNIVVPKDAAYYILSTKALLDGSPFPDDMKGGNQGADDLHPYDYTWVHNTDNISGSVHERYTNTNYDVNWTANVDWWHYDTSGHWPTSRENGVTDFVIAFRDVAWGDTDYGTSGNFAAGISINTDTAKLIKMDYKGSLDPWNITAAFSKDSSTNYSLSKYLVEFKRSKQIDLCSSTISATGFEEGFDVEYVGWCKKGHPLYKDEDNKFSSVAINSSAITITGLKETSPSSGTFYNIYKIVSDTDSNKFLYFLVKRG